MTDSSENGLVSIWLGVDLISPKIDILKKLCGVKYYDVDDQECILTDNGLMEPVDSLVTELSYSESFLKDVVAAYKKAGIENAYWVLAQYDFRYDPRKRKKHTKNPIFIGCFQYQDDDE